MRLCDPSMNVFLVGRMFPRSAGALHSAPRARPLPRLHIRGSGNYAPIDETADRVRAGFGDERFERLRRVKARHDPDNVFRFNHNIPAATAG